MTPASTPNATSATSALRGELPHVLLLAVNVAIAVFSWTTLPQIVPVHWNAAGEPDRIGDKAELLLLPLASLGSYLLLRLLPRIDPGRANYAQFAGAYAAIRLLVHAGLTALAAVTVLAAAGAPVPVSQAIGVITGLLVAGLGNLMGKVRPNFFVGIRTPWTLTSKRAWVKTHRVGGWVMSAFGVALMLAALAGLPTISGALGAAGGVSVVALAAYSFLVWRSDPERTPPAGTQPA